MVPERVIIIRHGESTGNVNKDVYATTPDWSVPLTDLGRLQAEMAGANLRKFLGTLHSVDTFGVYHSPWTRAAETTQAIVRQVSHSGLTPKFVTEDPRLQEQNYGGRLTDFDHNLREQIEEDRDVYGKFWYRLLNGENFSDVYNRIANFWVDKRLDWSERYQEVDTLVIVCHGATARLLQGYLQKLTVAEIVALRNPDNCEAIHLKRSVSKNKYEVVQG